MAIIELDQLHDTPVTTYKRGSTWIRYAYTRSKDSVQEKERGQDYLLFRSEPQRTVFAVCDGVGNSFFGGIGAQIVGESLVSWLWRQSDEELGNPNKLCDDLTKYLNGQSTIGVTLINRKDLGKYDNELQRNAYKNQLTEYGTQSNFVCGLIDTPSDKYPKGQVILFWLGDARLQIWNREEAKTDLLNAEWDSNEGWSSNKGILGTIHSYNTDLTQIDCVIAHTDGLNMVASRLRPQLQNDALQRAITKLQEGSKSDDISFLQIYVSLVAVDFDEDLSSFLRSELQANDGFIQRQPLDSDSTVHDHDTHPETIVSDPASIAVKPASISKPKRDSRKRVWFYAGGVALLIFLMWASFMIGMNYQKRITAVATPVAIQPTPDVILTLNSVLTDIAPTNTPQISMPSPSPVSPQIVITPSCEVPGCDIVSTAYPEIIVPTP